MFTFTGESFGSEGIRDKIRNHRSNLIILLLAACGVLVHLLFYKNLEFHRDELLYFSLGEHPDFGYYSVPPLIGILASGLTKIFGYSLFAAKILPAFAGGVMVYPAAKMVQELKGSLFTQILAAVGMMCSILFYALSASSSRCLWISFFGRSPFICC